MTLFEIAQIGKNTSWDLRAYNPLLTEKEVFACPKCGEKKAFIDLEVWINDTVENIVNGNVPCSACYENEMGDDL